jgi:hypothetical protein
VFFDDANRLVVVADLATSLTRSLLRCYPVPLSPAAGSTGDRDGSGSGIDSGGNNGGGGGGGGGNDSGGGGSGGGSSGGGGGGGGGDGSSGNGGGGSRNGDGGGGGGGAPFDIVIAPGAVMDVRFALGLNRLRVAVQRSHAEIEIVRRDMTGGHEQTGTRGGDSSGVGAGLGGFVYKVKKPGERILAFFWSTTPKVDFVVVTSLGVEQHQVVEEGEPSGGMALKLVSEKKKTSAPVSWCIYTHDTRLALLASGRELHHTSTFKSMIANDSRAHQSFRSQVNICAGHWHWAFVDPACWPSH